MPRELNIVSADSHLDILGNRWAPYVPSQYRDLIPKDPAGFVTDEGLKVAAYEGITARVYPDNVPDLTADFDNWPGTGSASQRLRELDIDGVDAEVLFPGALGPATWRANAKTDEAYLALVRGYNRHLWDEFCPTAPDRIYGLGVMPVTGIDDAIAEMEICMRNGLIGVDLCAFPSGKSHPSPEDDRFWAAAVELNCPLTVHVEFSYPVSTPTGVPTGVSPRSYGGGAPGPAFIYPKRPEQGFNDIVLRYAKYGIRGALHAVQMLWDGVFERFPTLQIYFAETQIGWIPNFYEQMDQHYLRHQLWTEKLLGLKTFDRLPSDYLKEHCWWGFVYNPVGVRTMASEVGIDRIMWASDFPHAESDWPNSQGVIDKSVAGLTEAQRQKIIAGNAIEFFNLG